jgi:hypothetical protein
MRRQRYERDGISYEISVYEVEGGYQARWKCLSCGRSGGLSYGSLSTAEAIGRAEGQLLDEHHAQVHRPTN